MLTIKHIVEECALYTSIRNDLKMPPNVAEALDEHNTPKIIKFLSITNIIKKIVNSVNNKCNINVLLILRNIYVTFSG